jgi:hypothetical protein
VSWFLVAAVATAVLCVTWYRNLPEAEPFDASESS